VHRSIVAFHVGSSRRHEGLDTGVDAMNVEEGPGSRDYSGARELLGTRAPSSSPEMDLGVKRDGRYSRSAAGQPHIVFTRISSSTFAYCAASSAPSIPWQFGSPKFPTWPGFAARSTPGSHGEGHIHDAATGCDAHPAHSCIHERGVRTPSSHPRTLCARSSLSKSLGP